MMRLEALTVIIDRAKNNQNGLVDKVSSGLSMEHCVVAVQLVMQVLWN